jgi:hypothetical protein
MQEHDWYYDNGEELSPDLGPGVLAGDVAKHRMAVERVYGLAWQRFTPADWDALQRIYQGLPGWQPFSFDVARWFSLDDDRDLYLWASVGPSGLQVSGVLTLDMWRDWDTQFRRASGAARVPVRLLPAGLATDANCPRRDGTCRRRTGRRGSGRRTTTPGR